MSAALAAPAASVASPGGCGAAVGLVAAGGAGAAVAVYGLPSATTPASATRCICRVRTITSATYPSGVAKAVCRDW